MTTSFTYPNLVGHLCLPRHRCARHQQPLEVIDGGVRFLNALTVKTLILRSKVVVTSCVFRWDAWQAVADLLNESCSLGHLTSEPDGRIGSGASVGSILSG